MNSPSFVIRPVDPQGEDALTLLHEAAVEARTLYPDLFGPESPWPVNMPTPPRGIYLIAYVSGKPMASGALYPINEQIVEVHRVYVMKEARRSGLGRLILSALEEQAVKLGYEVMWLETGNRQRAAMAMYESLGFRQIPPFGIYKSDPTSVCYEKTIKQGEGLL